MKEEKQWSSVNLNDFSEEGLYLIFPDSQRLAFTRKEITEAALALWSNSEALSEIIKADPDFQRCTFCYLKKEEGICDAIRPILPVFREVDKYLSYDKVTAVFKGSKQDMLYVSQTTMQDALKYISILSLMFYCQEGKKYWKYFFGIIPLVDPGELATKLFLNIYLVHKGNEEEISKVILEFNQKMRVTSANQVKRLSLVCRKDVLMNAFVNTELCSELLSMDIEKSIEEAFERFSGETRPDLG